MNFRPAILAFSTISFVVGVVAAWFWWTTVLAIAAAGCILAVIADRSEARRQRRRDQSPYGPVQKWGLVERRYVADSPFWTPSEAAPVRSEITHSPPAAGSVIQGGQEAAWHQQVQAFTEADGGELIVNGRRMALRIATQADMRRRRVSARRRVWAKLTSWPAIIALIFVIVPVGLYCAPHAGALYYGPPPITVSVVWSGEPFCIAAHEPNPNSRRQILDVSLCSPTQAVAATYTPQPGEWVGVDPEMSGADVLSCSIAKNGHVIFADSAARGDGTEVTCLYPWVG